MGSDESKESQDLKSVDESRNQENDSTHLDTKTREENQKEQKSRDNSPSAKSRSSTTDSNSPGKGRPRLKLTSVGGSLQKDIRNVYKFKNIIGGGQFGEVRIGYKFREEPAKQYAIKSILTKNFLSNEIDDLINEVEIISGLNHPNIVKFYETYHDQYYFHIVMELCTGKEVFDKIATDRKINEQKVASIIFKLTSAIAYCHFNGITHRDLKLENILFQSPDEEAEIKVIDFGLSKKYNTNEPMDAVIGTPYYVAPEVLKGEYDEKCDVWSIGTIAYMMLSGNPPFTGKSNNDIFNKILHNEVHFDKEKWKNISRDAKDFIQKCLNKQPDKRPHAIQAIEHPWLASVSKALHSQENLCIETLTNIKNCPYYPKFMKMVLRYLVSLLSLKEVHKFRKMFYAIDYTHTGHIDIEDLNKAFILSNIEISKEELASFFENVDDDNDGKLDYLDFLVACIEMNNSEHVNKEKLTSAFHHFDVDANGFIDSADLSNALLRSGKKILKSEDMEIILSEVSNTGKLKYDDLFKLFVII